MSAINVSSITAEHSLRALQRNLAWMGGIFILVIPVLGFILRLGSGGDLTDPRYVGVTVVMLATGIVTMYLLWLEQLRFASVIVATSMVLASLISAQQETRTLLGVVALIISGTLLGRWAYYSLLAAFVAMPLFSIVELVERNGFTFSTEAVGLVLTILLLIVVATLFRRMYFSAERATETAMDSYQRLTSIAAVGRQTSRILKYDELLTQSVDLIKQQFGFYHVQIFLVDEQREYAVLVASTGEAGRRLLSRNHKLGIGSQSVIGRTTLANEPVLINDTENEPGHAFNPLLPETRAELALPMQVQTENGLRVSGALDVQSEMPMAFSATDVQALQALANQLAVAIRNAQLFETQESSLRENETLFHQAQSSLDEIKRLNSQLTRQAWEGYVENHGSLSGIQTQGDVVTFNAGWTPLMIEACHARDTISHNDDGLRVTATPMMLRDEILGAVEIVGGDEDQINLIEAIVAFTERFAVALENVRLVEEAQTASAQEQRISSVVSRFQEAETVDELLQITLTELANTFDADGGSIRIGLSAGGQAAR